jgi:mRNA interferase RelE/StbE
MYAVYLKRSAEKELEELPPRVHDKVIEALLSLKDDPFPRNAKKLRGREGFWGGQGRSLNYDF